MSIAKVAGIETEFGIVLRGDKEQSPFLPARLLFSAFMRSDALAVPCQSSYFSAPARWQPSAPFLSHKDDEPHLARSRLSDPREYQLFSYMLPNGARFYIDHAHPEYSTPECRDARDLVAADKAGDVLLDRCRRLANAQLPPDQAIEIYKNNSDFKGASYGCHENYLMRANTFERLLYDDQEQLFRTLVPFLVTRIIFCGAGKVGVENGQAAATFQLAQRADFFETLVGLQTTEHRPLINMRDEPHADFRRYRRLHVIVGDANMAEYATWLKVGTTQIVLRMIEDHAIPDDLTLAQPLDALRAISRDLTFTHTVTTRVLGEMTALDIQRRYLAAARSYLMTNGADTEDSAILDVWQEMLDDLADGAPRLRRRCDWAIKHLLLTQYLTQMRTTWEAVAAWQPIIEALNALDRQRVIADPAAMLQTLPQAEQTNLRDRMRDDTLDWEDYATQRQVYFGLRGIDLRYHAIDLGPDPRQMGLYYQLCAAKAVDRVVSDDAIAVRLDTPPSDTRAWLRGAWIREFAPTMLNADWSQLRFERGGEHVVITLADPLANRQADWQFCWDIIHRIVTPTTNLSQTHQRSERNCNGTGTPSTTPATTAAAAAATASADSATTTDDPGE